MAKLIQLHGPLAGGKVVPPDAVQEYRLALLKGLRDVKVGSFINIAEPGQPGRLNTVATCVCTPPSNVWKQSQRDGRA